MANEQTAVTQSGDKEAILKEGHDTRSELADESSAAPRNNGSYQPDATKEVPPPSESTGKVAGFGIDEILKAPVTPPQPHQSSGPKVTEKIDEAGYQASAKLGPKKPSRENVIIVGLGIFIALVGLIGLAFLSLGAGLSILAVGFVLTAIGSFAKL